MRLLAYAYKKGKKYTSKRVITHTRGRVISLKMVMRDTSPVSQDMIIYIKLYTIRYHTRISNRDLHLK